MLQAEPFDLGVKTRQMFDELLDYDRIEMNSRTAQQQRSRFVERHAAAKRSIFANRVEAIDNRDNARGDGDLFAAQAVRITAAVPLFVVMPDDRNHWIREIHTTEDLGAHDRVDLHLLKLSMSQRSRLIQNVRRNGKLADVMQQRTRFECGDLVRRKTKHFAHARGVNLHATNVAM